jgi:hypothetical protein
MKSGVIPVSTIALQIAMNSHGWPMHSLNPAGLPPDSSRIRAMNCHKLDRRRKGTNGGRRDAILPHRHAADRRSRPSPWRPASTPPWPGFAPCDSFSFDHLDLRIGGVFGKLYRIEIRRPARAPK